MGKNPLLYIVQAYQGIELGYSIGRVGNLHFGDVCCLNHQLTDILRGDPFSHHTTDHVWQDHVLDDLLDVSRIRKAVAAH